MPDPRATAIDARPILPRGEANVWERAEAHRARIGGLIESACRARNTEALVIQSDPYEHPAWVKFECWVPADERSLTARSAFTITAEARPYFDYEVVYKVGWEKQGHSGSIHSIYAIEEPEIVALVNHLCTPGPVRQRWVYSLLRQRQLRQAWWHFWKPTNKLTAVRPDWVRRLSGAAAAIGATLLIYALSTTGAASAAATARGPQLSASLQSATSLHVNRVSIADGHSASNFWARRTLAHWVLQSAPPSGGHDLAPADRRGAALVPRAPVVIRASFAQEPSRHGSPLPTTGTARGSLDGTDPEHPGGNKYERWTFEGRAGEQLVAAVRSSAFDTTLALRWAGSGDMPILADNDDSGGTSDSRIEIALPETGSYVLEVSSFNEGVGNYTLEVRRRDPPDSPPAASPTPRPEVPPSTASPPLPEPTVDDYSASVFDEQASPMPGLLGTVFLLLGGVGLVIAARAPRFVRSAGKPLADPRYLSYLDSWQTVLFGAGHDAELIKSRLMELFTGPTQDRFACRVERIWRWGLDGKMEREQIVLLYSRALVFCQIYAYGSDLYIGWEAQMNFGTWQEKRAATGIDRETGQRVELMTVVAAVQRTTEYDLVDLNCLAEWTHAQVVQVVKHYLKERQIDQEVNFSIIRGERKELTSRDDKDGKKATERRFRRKA